jgi:tRNA(Arg) A34 adenosine deaminase TadA
MISWNELSPPWQACIELAWEAYCDDCIPIGAVVTDAAGTILSRGRNRIYEKPTARGHTRNDQLAHAEMEALRSPDFDQTDANTCRLYTTTEPCPMCLGAFYMSGARTLHYASRDPWAGSVDLLNKTWYLSRKPIKVFHPFSPALELIAMGLMIEQDYFRNNGDLPPGIWGSLYKRWSATVPHCLPFGKMLYMTGVLQSLRTAQAPASELLTAAAKVTTLL